MSFVNIPERTTDDANSFADINQLQENIRVLGGNGADAPTSDITTLKTDVSELQSYIYASTHIHQIKQNHVIDVYGYTYTTTRANAVEIACLTTSITTTQTDSSVAIDMLINGDWQWDSVLILERVVGGVATEIGSATPGGSYYGISCLPYDNNQDSTMGQIIIQYVDTPAQAAGTTITYRVKIVGTASTIRINSAYTTTTTERATSNVRLTEFGGTPIIIDSVTSIIATTAEAQAGTNDVNIVTPLKLREGLNATGDAPVYACRAWVNFDGTTNTDGYCAIRASGNVSSITDDGVGEYIINFTNAMPDANYSVSIIGNGAVSTQHAVGFIDSANFTGESEIYTTTQCKIIFVNCANGNLRADQSVVCVNVFR